MPPRYSTHSPRKRPRPPRGRWVDAAMGAQKAVRNGRRAVLTDPFSARWTFGGRRASDSSPEEATQMAGLQRLFAEPLTDSNRRPPPYHRRGGKRGHGREAAGMKAAQEEGIVR